MTVCIAEQLDLDDYEDFVQITSPVSSGFMEDFIVSG